MKVQRIVPVLVLAMALPFAAARAAPEDPAADCFRSAASGSTEPLACDLAVQVATRTGDSRAAAAAYTNRGIVLGRGGRLELALKDHSEALTLQPQHPAALMNRAYVLLRLGRLNDALRDYDAAAAAEPDSALVYFNRAFAQLALGDAAAAEADVAQARALLAQRIR